jgi:plastocyanin
MKKVIIAVIVLAVAGVATYYLVFNKSTGSYMPPMTNTGTNTSGSMEPTGISVSATTSIGNTAQESDIVTLKNFAFIPQTLTVKKGTTVTWINNDSVSHTITSDAGSLLNSGIISPGGSFTFTFSRPMSVAYHCSIHPTMKGMVVVTN